MASGAGYEKLLTFVEAQGGDSAAVDRGLPVSEEVWEVAAPSAGHLARVDAGRIGRAALALGARRQRKEDPILFDVGLELLAKVGDHVEAGQPLADVLTGNVAMAVADGAMAGVAAHRSVMF